MTATDWREVSEAIARAGAKVQAVADHAVFLFCLAVLVALLLGWPA